MKIEELADNMSPRRMIGLRHTNNKGRVGRSATRKSGHTGRAGRDSVDMSMLSRVVANNLKNLSKSNRMRRAKVEEFGLQRGKDNTGISDKTIEAVLLRMIGR